MSNFKRAIQTTVIFIVVLTIMSACIMEVFFAVKIIIIRIQENVMN